MKLAAHARLQIHSLSAMSWPVIKVHSCRVRCMQRLRVLRGIHHIYRTHGHVHYNMIAECMYKCMSLNPLVTSSWWRAECLITFLRGPEVKLLLTKLVRVLSCLTRLVITATYMSFCHEMHIINIIVAMMSFCHEMHIINIIVAMIYTIV